MKKDYEYKTIIEYFLLILIVIIISFSFSYAYSIIKPPIKEELNFLKIIETTLLFGGIGLIGLTILYLILLKRTSIYIKAMISAILSPVIVMGLVIFAETLILILYKQLSIALISLIILASLYLTMIIEILIITDMLPIKIKNFIMVFYGAIFGSFFGVIIPTIVIILIGILIAFFDVFLVNFIFLKKVKELIGKGAYVGKFIEIGLGEFIFYAIPPSLSYYRFGFLIFILSSLLIFLGCIINFLILLRKRIVAGLTIPTLLGIIPPLINHIIK
ncbi:MAG: hypothetical protein QXF09_02855 [Nitrososphaerota archaeon]